MLMHLFNLMLTMVFELTMVGLIVLTFMVVAYGHEYKNK